MLRTARKVPSNSNLAAVASPSPGSTSSTAMRRKRKESECLLKLERVIGLTSNKPMVLSVNSSNGLVAYAAGCIIVLYNHKTNKQVGLLCSSTLKKSSPADTGMAGTGGSIGGSGTRGIGGSPRMTPMSTSSSSQWSAFAGPNINPLAGLMPMAMSDVSTASSFGTSNPNSNKGIKPKLISCLSFSPDGQFLAVGETGHQPRIMIWEVSSQTLVGELHGHKFGVQAVQFSPNSKHLVSLGFQHDGYIHLWNWKAGLQIASNRVTTKVNALAFSADGTFFVTAGLRHIKFWYLNVGANKRGLANTKVLDGRAAILGDLRDGNYVDAACSTDGRFTYAITSNGILCLFSEGRAMEKWINLHTRGAYSVNLDERFVICACTDGNVRLFEPETLQYIGTLPKPSPTGELSRNMDSDLEDADTTNSIFSDVLASQYDATSGCLMCIYSDRSLYVWDINDPLSAKASRSHHSHSDCIWGTEIIPKSVDDTDGSAYPPDTFVTYSADGSIIFWSLDESISLLPPLSGPNDKDLISSEARKEIIDILYVDDNCKSLIQLPETQDGVEPGFNVVPVEFGVRTVKISADGKLLASGDKGGNLRVHNLSSLKQVTYQEAHDTEIMTIDFTDPHSKDSPFLVATAGRDRLLHIFDVTNDYALVQTLDDHSSSIACIRFTLDGSRMMSCGADKSIIFRSRQKNLDGSEGYSYQPYHQAPGRATFYEMELCDESQTVSVVSGDRRFNVFALDSGKSITSFKAEAKGDDLTAGMAEVCSMNHLSLDPSGTIAVASGSDKSVRIYDLLHGTCLAHMICHSEMVTSVKFMNGYDRIISTSADGCILIWRLSKEIVRRINARIHENVTLPGYIQAKAAEKAMATASYPVVSPSPRPLRHRKSTDKLGANGSEYSGTSRRNSIASAVSDDGDFHADDISESWNEIRRGLSPRGRRFDDVSKESFEPVTVNSTGSPRTPATRSRVSGSISITPITRSRRNSTSQPATTRPRPLTPTRPSVQLEQPAWNRNVSKVKSTPSLNPPGSATPRQLTPKPAAKSDRLRANPRPRAISLTVPNEATLKLDNPKSQTQPRERQSLSDYSREDPPAAPGDGDDEMLSDDTESVFEDGLGYVPKGLHTRDIIGEAKSSLGNMSSSVRSLINEDHQKSRSDDSGQEGSETDLIDEAGASEERDGDDEQADEDESISETGSDNEPLSPLRRIITGQSMFRHKNIGSGPNSIDSHGDEVSSGFNEGERLRDSPKSERVTSPSGRVISILSAGGGRRSISSIFLTAHAATTMTGLTQTSPKETDSHSPLANPPSSTHDDPETGVVSGEQSESRTLDDSSNDVLLHNNVQDGSPEEHLNLQSLNAAALRWNQGSLGSGSTALDHQEDLEENHKFTTSQPNGKQEVEDATEKVVEDGHANAPESTQKEDSIELADEIALNNSATLNDVSQVTSSTKLADSPDALVNQEAQIPMLPQSQGGILASPVELKEPEVINYGSGNTGNSLSHTSAIQVNEGPQGSVASGDDKDKARGKYNDDSDEQSLRDAFERISFLISYKAMSATCPDRQRLESLHYGEANEDGGIGSSSTTDAGNERVRQTKRWLLETREGLLNLVGEIQGHLWIIEKGGKLDQE
ncbi:mitogen-activated protein kinase binding protein 1 [Entomortierella lignicola]|nr:mitogen-activated protein kinase binding protein 1 [Entomortierella lignicola]